jgi:quinol monooxygenase YgiN
MSDSLTLIAAFQAKPGHDDRLRDELNAMIEPSEAEPGCLGYRPLVDPNAPGAMVIVEDWLDQAAVEFHFTTSHFKRDAAVLTEILAEPFTLRTLAPAPEEVAEPG